ncbi:MAG: AAA family ATPase [Patescibacteria group bacterium]|mgnify:CR=1 FL=1
MKLIILNGTAGVGKTTLAKKLYQELPLSFLVNMDRQRRFISKYREHPKESNDLSFAVSIAIVEACLKAKHDVIVDKMMWNINNNLNRLESLGRENKATIYEFILEARKETVVKRVNKRGYKPGGLLTPEKVDRFWETTKNLKIERPDAIVIDTDQLNEDQVFEKVKKIVLGK